MPAGVGPAGRLAAGRACDDPCVMRFVGLEEARAATGLKLVVAASLPSPWSEAAKGILHVKAQTRGNSEAPGTGTGLPLMGSFAFQLAPRLSVLGFSRLGCPITSGVGAVMAYEVPVTRSLSVSLSGSAYAMPQALDKGVATRGLLRVDVVKKDPGSGMTQTWGVQALGARGTSSMSTVSATYGLHW
jgi:hypothetical protein